MKKCNLRRTCENCGKAFGRKIMTSGTGVGYYESEKQFNDRPYCGRSCASAGNARRRAEQADRRRQLRDALAATQNFYYRKFCLGAKSAFSSINYLYNFDNVIQVDFRKEVA